MNYPPMIVNAIGIAYESGLGEKDSIGFGRIEEYRNDRK